MLHVPPTFPLSVTLPPEQNVVFPPAEITDAVGLGFTVTACEAVPLQPTASVTVTVEVLEDETLIAEVVAPVDHK